MAGAARTVSVIVEANSTDLQAAVAKAATSLRGLGETIAKQQKAALAGSDLTVQSNKAVSASYEQMSTVATASLRRVAEGQALGAKAMRDAGAAAREQAVATEKNATMQQLLAIQLRGAELAVRKQEAAVHAHNNALTRAGSTLDQTGRKLQGFGRLMAPVSLGLLGIGAYAVKSSVQFQSAMELIHTQAGATQGEVGKMTTALLKMGETGDRTPEELAKGLFHIESAGYRGAAALNALEGAAKGAAIGHAELESVTNALTGVLRAGIGGVHGAGDAMSQLNAIIGEGNMRMQDLTAALGTGIALSAKEFGLHLRDVGAALDEMTVKGMPAEQAATRLRMALTQMEGPTKKATEELAKIGISGSQLAEDMRKPNGLLIAVTDLKTHMDAAGLSATQQAQLLVHSFGGARSSGAILALVQDVGGLNKKYQELGSNTGITAFNEKFTAASKTTEYKWHQMVSSMQTDSIKLGTSLLPVANDIIGDVTKMVDWFSKLPAPVKHSAEVFAALGAVLGPVAYAAGSLSRLGAVPLKLAGALGGASGGGSLGKTLPGGLVGARGPTLAGSLANPVVVAIEDGQYAGLGGQAAPLGARATAAEKAGSAGALTAEEAAAGGGIVTAVKTGLGSILSKVGRGAGIAGVGVIGSQIAGEAIGGSIGHTVADVGTGAAVGAGIGSIVPGVGTALGAGGGALVGLVNEHKNAIHDFLFGQSKSGEDEEALAKISKQLEAVGGNVAALNPSQMAKLHDEAVRLGRDGGKGIDNVITELVSLQKATGPAAQAVAQANSQMSGAFSAMANSSHRSLSDIMGEAQTTADGIRQQMGSGSLAAKDALSQNFALAAQAVKQHMHDTGQYTAKGISDIDSLMRKALAAYGIKAPKGISSSQMGEALQGAREGGTGIGFNKAGGVEEQGIKAHAQGGLVQLGKPGDAGRDTIPLNAGGIPIMAGAGEQIAVFTRHQQAVANAALAPMGGLPGLFKGVSTPHYMAQGGFTPGQAYAGLTRGRIDQGVDFGGSGPVRAVEDGTVRSTGLWPGWPGTGGMVYSTSRGNVYIMEDFAPSVRSGQTVTAGQVIGQATGGSTGIETGWADASGTRPIVQYGSAPDGTPMPGGKSFSAFLGGGGTSGVLGAAVAKAIAEPHLKLTGVIGQIAQAAIHKVTQAANQTLGSLGGASRTPSFAGVTGKGGAPSANEALGKQMMLAAGWGANEWPALQALWTQESGWNANSVNSSSGAYGIPQALGHGHPFNLGDAKAQIAWGLNYIKGRYGSPSGAEAHERAFNWYEQGGIVNAATGVLAKAKAKPWKPPHHATKIKNTGKGHQPKPGLAALIHQLGAVPDTENVKRLQGFPPLLASLANEHSLLSKIQGLPDRTFIQPEDMAQLQHTIQPGQNIHPGMTISSAQREQLAAMTRAKGNSQPLTEQGEILTWLGELPSHHLLTASDVGVLQSAGVHDPTVVAGLPVYSAAENVLGWEVNKNERLVAAEQEVQETWEDLAEKYKDRQAKIRAHENAEFKRYTNIKKQIERLSIGQLRSRVAAAENHDYNAQLIADAHASEEALTENIAGEKLLPSKSQNKKLIAEWEADKRHMGGYIRGLSKPPSAKGAALVNLRKAELSNELGPIQENLFTLGGSRTAVGKNGDFGMVGGYIKRLNEGITKLGGEIQTGEESTIPGLKIELEQQHAENMDANLKPAPPALEAGETAQEAALLALQKQLSQQLSETVSLQGAQLKTFQNFIPQIPRFAQGGPVLDDGLIYAHKGEHVVPVGGTLAVNSSAPVFNHKTDVHGNVAGLIELIDSRVTHPTNVRINSQQMARRSNLLTGRI
jgi:TP901 family phage tail tape measure protein